MLDERAPLLDGHRMPPALRRRLRRVLEHPTPENWNDAYGIVLRAEPGLTLTLWGAVRAVDENFPGMKAVGRRCDLLLLDLQE
jgi:hypothetical protein